MLSVRLLFSLQNVILVNIGGVSDIIFNIRIYPTVREQYTNQPVLDAHVALLRAITSYCHNSI